MAKQKTSRKQGFSFKNMESVSIARASSLKTHDPKASLRDPHLVFKALIQSLVDGDSEAFKEILSAHLSVVNKDRFSTKAKIPKRTLFRMLSPDGNPTLDTIARVVHALGAA